MPCVAFINITVGQNVVYYLQLRLSESTHLTPLNVISKVQYLLLGHFNLIDRYLFYHRNVFWSRKCFPDVAKTCFFFPQEFFFHA